MAKKEWTDEERKAFGEKMRAARDKTTPPETVADKVPPTTTVPVTDVQDAPNLSDMQRQLNEVMETNALLKAALLNNQQNQQQQPSNGINVGQGGRLLGEVDKYLVDTDRYPNPTKRLSEENRLASIAFNHNYELMYDFSVRSYETKTGVNMREPEFLITLLRVVLDDQGNRVQVADKNGNLKDKFYIARRLVFHEDPQAALVIARDNNILIDREDEKHFLDEMRYLRVRDWLFDYLWPKQADEKSGIVEESVGGTLVQVFTKSSVDPSSVDFDQLKSKV